MEDLSAIAAFVRVVEAHSFAAAARQMTLSASGVSRAVARLETGLGVRLLARTTRSLSVTEEGRAFYERCRRILADLDEATESIGAAREHPRGRLRLAAAMSVGRALVLPHLAEFHERYPDIQLEMVLGDRVLDMVEEGIDCALRVGELADSSMVARRIGQFRTLTCASPAYLEKYGRPHRLDELGKHRCIGYARSASGVLPWVFWTDEGRTSVDIAPMLTLNDAESVIQAGVQGLGLIQTGYVVAATYLKHGKLVPVFEDLETTGPEVWIVYPQRRHLSSRVQVFIDWISEVFEREGRCCPHAHRAMAATA
ncbi:MAG TPA: LysR family transcriptional regulator [Rhodanobacteraceae bacterium]